MKDKLFELATQILAAAGKLEEITGNAKHILTELQDNSHSQLFQTRANTKEAATEFNYGLLKARPVEELQAMRASLAAKKLDLTAQNLAFETLTAAVNAVDAATGVALATRQRLLELLQPLLEN